MDSAESAPRWERSTRAKVRGIDLSIIVNNGSSRCDFNSTSDLDLSGSQSAMHAKSAPDGFAQIYIAPDVLNGLDYVALAAVALQVCVLKRLVFGSLSKCWFGGSPVSVRKAYLLLSLHSMTLQRTGPQHVRECWLSAAADHRLPLMPNCKFCVRRNANLV